MENTLHTSTKVPLDELNPAASPWMRVRPAWMADKHTFDSVLKALWVPNTCCPLIGNAKRHSLSHSICTLSPTANAAKGASVPRVPQSIRTRAKEACDQQQHSIAHRQTDLMDSQKQSDDVQDYASLTSPRNRYSKSC